MGKSAAALLLQSRIGETFEALVTGASKRHLGSRAQSAGGRPIGGGTEVST